MSAPNRSPGAGQYKGRLPAWVRAKIKRAIRNAHALAPAATSLVLAAFLLLPLVAVAQMLGGAECQKPPKGEFVEIRLSLMEDGRERKYKTVKAEEIVPPGVVVEFNEVTTAFTMTGFRMRCTFTPNDGTFSKIEQSTEQQWATHRIPMPVGSKPKLGLNVQEIAPGVVRAWIGTNTASGTGT